jgi:hypothetical protein
MTYEWNQEKAGLTFSQAEGSIKFIFITLDLHLPLNISVGCLGDI